MIFKLDCENKNNNCFLLLSKIKIVNNDFLQVYYKMKIEHVAVGSNSEQDADKFFISLLGLEKTRSFTVSSDLMEQFFGLNREQKIIRYGNSDLNFEVFITENMETAKDTFTHSCLVIENRDEFLNKAITLGFHTIKVPRKDSDSYYLFIKDLFDNLYEIKEK